MENSTKSDECKQNNSVLSSLITQRFQKKKYKKIIITRDGENNLNEEKKTEAIIFNFKAITLRDIN